MPLKNLVTITRTTGPSQIRRVDGKRTITLQITPPEHMSIEQTIAILKQQVDPKIQQRLNPSDEINYRGSAEALKVAIANMSQSFILALVILFLIMAAYLLSPNKVNTMQGISALSRPQAGFSSQFSVCSSQLFNSSCKLKTENCKLRTILIRFRSRLKIIFITFDDEA